MGSITRLSPSESKVALFRSLFKGREDAFPRRFENQKKSKSGYSPVCANEWVRGLCDKKTIKCSKCQNRRFLPVTDEVIHQHLSGVDKNGRPFVIGVYPMLQDETCFFLAADFDKETWRDDVSEFLETSRHLSIPTSLERSRSGNGAHVWFFFETAISAVLARKLGAYILTETLERRPDVGLRSYDRFFPNQDTLPKGGFGNLIALPLQKRAREKQNSVFLDEQFTPYSDQWEFLSRIKKISQLELEKIVREAEEKDKILGIRRVHIEENEDTPWATPPSRRRKEPPITGTPPEKLELVFGNRIYVAKELLIPSLRNRLTRLAAFQNPEFYKAQAMRLPTFEKPRIICCVEDHSRHLGLPRGCLEEVRRLLEDLKIEPVIRDERFTGAPLSVSFKGELRPEQEKAAKAMLAHDIGVLAATTAFGKTVIGAWLIALRGVNTLILVHRKQLLEQWVERLSMFLDIPAKNIGRIGGGAKKPKGMIDVALIQSLIRKNIVNDVVAGYGHIIVDECHHLSAQSFEHVISAAKAKFVVGLSATVTRKDGHHPIIFMHCGPVRYQVDAKAQALARPFTHTVVVRPTGFYSIEAPDPDPRILFNNLYNELTANEARNNMIAQDVIQSVREKRSSIILTERNEHIERLATLLEPEIKNLLILRGGMGKKKLKAITEQLSAIPEHEDRVLLATGKFIGEGFDDPRLDTLFLTLPVSWKGTIAQYSGRLHRLHDLKREVRIYDYSDLNVPMLSRMFDRRCSGYEAIGYKIQLPASAVPGWPANVPLPVDPEWKKDYSGSIRRLICDGVDTPLASLFLHVARRWNPDAEGINRARSATEAFLYRRLESLPPTTGKFQLNVELPIAFDGQGKMEVDLLCSKARLAIELDGPQHLNELEAYRRDRRKDELLQENGYFVLRFLSEDVGKHLDHVLDSILRVLTHRNLAEKGLSIR
ncbi:MAG: DEAD/DEAH box helicase family protein [Candidatus Riflebacteria bacterium]|nr:DEAD/DEAH box helicase family protein [Candidatus Riflebacteria bacterium]